MASPPPPNSVGWHILEGYPWWPVYVCDPFKLRPKLHLLGNGHRRILRKAKDFSKDFGVVYYFGSHDFAQAALKKGVLKPWDCKEQESFLKGHPSHLVKKKAIMEDLQMAIQEAEDYLSQPEDMRLPPCMVPSDLDPTLEPPPEIEIPEPAQSEGGEDDEEAGAEGEGDEEDAASEGDDADDGDHDMGGSDAETLQKKKKKKEKSLKKKSSAELKDEKKKKKKSSSSSSLSSKDKKASKKEHSSSNDKTKSSKSSSSTKGNKVSDEKNENDKKRKKPSPSDAPDDEASSGSKSPPKAAKTEKSTDVKYETSSAPVEMKAEETSESKPKIKMERPATEPSGESLSAVLEKEIRWILVNYQFDEMTTKTVRKLLEKRLNMDLRHHKASIKEGVARVIASMEDEAEAEPNSNEAEVKEKSDSTAANEEPVKDEPIKDEPIKDEPVLAPASIPEPIVEEKDISQRLVDAEKDLAADSEPKLVETLKELATIPSVERETLTGSLLLPKLIQLQSHSSASVTELVATLVTQWGVEDLISSPEPVDESDILEMKEKLVNPDTSHDEIVVCLEKLAKMPIQISHLKSTGIARAVAKLRQHANDKVSSMAYNLRKSWMQLVDKEKQDNNLDRLNQLEEMNRILEQRLDQDGDESVRAAQLSTLDKLHGMSLSTQEIIESKIGVVVSKLRKSSNEKIAHAATKLRKKWKNEAAAS